MLDGIRIYCSDLAWRQILSDLNATLSETPGFADLNFDLLKIDTPISVIDLKTLILKSTDDSEIIRKIFGSNVNLTRLQSMIVVSLYKTGGLNAEELKIALGYSPNATTHTVDTAIYQLRKMYGHDFIKNNQGIYSIGKLQTDLL